MQEFKIESEDPVVHWPDINVKNKNVLDLGCGRWEETDQTKMTPIYLLAQGAKSLIGIDSSIEEIKYFRSLNLTNATFFAESIKDSLLVKLIIKQNNINAIKSDIEGKELLFLDFTAEDVVNITSLYIEYHGHYIKDLLIPKIKDLGFTITKIGHLWIDGFGVLFCEK
jgi:SAM-dependent methyltransferase